MNNGERCRILYKIPVAELRMSIYVSTFDVYVLD